MRKLPLLWRVGVALLLSAVALQAPECVAQRRATATVTTDTANLFRLLGYTVGESGPLRFYDRHAGTIRLAESGAAAGAPGAAVMEVFPDHVDGSEAQSARNVTEAAAGVRSVSIRSGEVISLDGTTGYEVVASAVDSATGIPLTLYSAVAPSRNGHVHFRGSVDARREAEILPVFRAVAGSFRRTDVIRAELDGVRFEVTGGYAAVSATGDGGAALFRDEETHSGLFIAVPREGFRDSAMVGDLLRRVVAAAVPGQKASFRWKARTTAPASRFEVATQRVRGFNGQVLVEVQFRDLRFEGRDIVTGYYYVFNQPKEAAEIWTSGAGTDSYPAGEASAWLIRSVVGEAPANTYAPPPMAGGPPEKP